MDRSSSRRWSFAVLVSVLVAGCADDGAVVYVPGSSFVEGLYVTSERRPPARIEVGEPLVLHAQRRSGPWVTRSARDMEDDECTSSVLPAQLEIEVADEVTWLVSPQGHASLAPAEDGDGAMAVRFDSAGTYHLSAESPSVCGGALRGQTLVVEVVGPR